MIAAITVLLACAAVVCLMMWTIERKAEEEARFEAELTAMLESLDGYSHLQQRSMETSRPCKLTRLK